MKAQIIIFLAKVTLTLVVEEYDTSPNQVSVCLFFCLFVFQSTISTYNMLSIIAKLQLENDS